MLRISSSEKKFLEDGIAQNIRNDGRACMDLRPFSIETGILTQTNGSARLKWGSNTDVIVGIKVETGTPDPNKPKEGLMHFSVECCPSASSEFEGKGAEALNHELSAVLERILLQSHTIDLTKLCIIADKLCWILYIDAMVLDSGGNLFDAISLATKAALHNTMIPKVIVNEEIGEFEVSDDPESFTKLDVTNVPICISLAKIGSAHVVDSTLEEEQCMSVRLTVAVNKDGNICGIQKGGHGGLDASSMYEMILAARKLGPNLIKSLETYLKEEETKAALSGNRPKGFI